MDAGTSAEKKSRVGLLWTRRVSESSECRSERNGRETERKMHKLEQQGNLGQVGPDLNSPLQRTEIPEGDPQKIPEPFQKKEQVYSTVQ